MTKISEYRTQRLMYLHNAEVLETAHFTSTAPLYMTTKACLLRTEEPLAAAARRDRLAAGRRLIQVALGLAKPAGIGADWLAAAELFEQHVAGTPHIDYNAIWAKHEREETAALRTALEITDAGRKHLSKHPFPALTSGLTKRQQQRVAHYIALAARKQLEQAST